VQRAIFSHVILAAAAVLLATVALIAHVRTAAAQPANTLVPFSVTGDIIAAPLDNKIGDGARGRSLVRDRQLGNCLICHAAPEPDERFMGNLAPDLKGVGARLTSGQIRLRLVDQTRINPDSIMPPYYRTEDLSRVAPRYRGQPALSAQQIEDIVAYLATLKE
jgi:L-cysteine S-thiosulfotransferase